MSVESLLSEVRGRLAVIARRRDELRAELDALDQEQDRLASAASVIEEHRAGVPPSDSSGGRVRVRLADRILDGIGEDGTRRAELLKKFLGGEVTVSALDGALHRLTVRGAIRREGRRIFRGSTGSADAGLAVGPAPGSPVADGVDPGSHRSGDSPPVPESDSAPGPARPPAGGDGRFLTVRVREAVAEGHATRKELIKHFAPQGVQESSLDEALRGLRRHRIIRRHPGGGIEVLREPASQASRGPR